MMKDQLRLLADRAYWVMQADVVSAEEAVKRLAPDLTPLQQAEVFANLEFIFDNEGI